MNRTEIKKASQEVAEILLKYGATSEEAGLILRGTEDFIYFRATALPQQELQGHSEA